MGFFALNVMQAKGSRVSELYTPFSPTVTQKVDMIRKSSIAQQGPEQKMINNRFTVYSNDLVSRSFEIFSLHNIFVQTDNFVGLYRIGFFFFIDAIFLLLGSLYLFAHARPKFYLITPSLS